jgi:hypothetical protein
MSIAEILELVKGLGTAAGPIFAILWYLERGERIDAQGELKQIAKESTTAMVAIEKTVEKWTSVFNSGEAR